MTGASSAEIPAVMTLASCGLDGAIAPTRSGASNHSRKNDIECMSGHRRASMQSLVMDRRLPKESNAPAVQRIREHAEHQPCRSERRADPWNAAVGPAVG